MKIAGAVILYYPDENITRHILSYIHVLDKLYVADNSENKNNALFEQIIKIKNVVYLHDGENKGIASRLNQAAKLAIEEGCEWLLTMDQDSYFEKNTVDAYLNCFSQSDGIDQVAMFGINFLDQKNKNEACSPAQVTELITSGSLVNLKVLITTGGFDEALFIDLVDHEYCYKAILYGYKIIQFKNIFLHHELGINIGGRSVATLKITKRTLHSPLRLYYMVRNFLYVRSKYYPDFKPVIDNQRKTIIVRIKNNLLYGKNKVSTINYIIKALIDYRNKEMGKIKLKQI